LTILLTINGIWFTVIYIAVEKKPLDNRPRLRGLISPSFWQFWDSIIARVQERAQPTETKLPFLDCFGSYVIDLPAL